MPVSDDSLAAGAVDDDTNTLLRLRAAKAKYAQQILELAQNPRPTYELDGKKVNWQEYQTFLVNQISNLNKLINSLDPEEVVSQAFT